MNTVTLQVPMNKELRDKAAKVAEDQGFSSLQEVVRVLVNRFAKGRLAITTESPVIQLSAKASKRYDRMVEEIESGKVKAFSTNSVDELMAHLNGN